MAGRAFPRRCHSAGHRSGRGSAGICDSVAGHRRDPDHGSGSGPNDPAARLGLKPGAGPAGCPDEVCTYKHNGIMLSVPCKQAGNDSTRHLASGWVTSRVFQALPAQPNYVLHCRPSNGSCATLEVRASNEAALAMYRKAGFRAAGFRRAYYSDGEDAVLMNLEAGNTR